jgi:membrane protease YdiL (CAAX protease family)
MRSGVKTDVGIALALGLLGAVLGQRFVGLSLPLTPPYWLAAWPLLLAPALEEAVFRVGLQAGLQAVLKDWLGSFLKASKNTQKIPPSRQYLYTELASNTVASLCFAACHAPAQGWAAVWWLLPSLVLGELWRRHRRWSVCAGVHAGFNLSLAGVSTGFLF